MKRLSTLAMVALLLGAARMSSAAHLRGWRGEMMEGQPVVSGPAATFYAALAPYGDWVNRRPYGDVWVPRDVPTGWRPYTVGSWANTDDGWTWVSDFDWGWAPFHYGRWVYDADLGWVWIPGDEWAPAWVDWRIGDGFVGWAPLGYDAGFFGGFGLGFGDISDAAWVFVDDDDFLRPHLREVVEPVDRDDYYLARTQDAGRPTLEAGRVVNRGIDPVAIQRTTGRTVPRYQVVNGSSPGALRKGRTLQVYRPNVTQSTPPTRQLAVQQPDRSTATRRLFGQSLVTRQPQSTTSELRMSTRPQARVLRAPTTYQPPRRQMTLRAPVQYQPRQQTSGQRFAIRPTYQGRRGR